MKSFRKDGFVGIADCSMPSTTNTNNTSIVTGVPPAVHGINGNYYLNSETGKEIMITDASRLRCGTILGAMSHAGVRTAVVTAKDKLLKVLAYKMSGINFPPNMPARPISKDNKIDNVEQLVGRLAARPIFGGPFAVRLGCRRENPVVRQAGPHVPVDVRLRAAQARARRTRGRRLSPCGRYDRRQA